MKPAKTHIIDLGPEHKVIPAMACIKPGVATTKAGCPNE